MGVTDSKTISSRIDDQFKSIRKYNDNLYGEITLVREKSTGRPFALVEKLIVSVDKSMSELLVQRKQFSPYLVRLHEYYHCSVDYCSTSQKYFFLLQYSQHTLYSQISIRQQSKGRFTSLQLFNIFNSYLQLTSYLRDKKQPFKFKSSISNHYILYYSPQQLKTLQSMLKVDSDDFQFDFHRVRNGEGLEQLYLAPQAYELMCNKESFEARHISHTQKAVVFMLGMNFIECALLTDISDVYNPFKRCIQFCSLKKILSEVDYIYGRQIYQMVSQMVSQPPSERPSIKNLKDYVRTNLTRRRIVTPRHAHSQGVKLKELHA